MRYVTIALCFGIVAALTRDYFRSLETRIQVISFVGLSAGYEYLWKQRTGQSPSAGSFAANAIFGIAAVLMVRWQLEGLCPGSNKMRCVPTEQSVAVALEHRPLMPSIRSNSITPKTASMSKIVA
jgi:hypothetical protein